MRRVIALCVAALVAGCGGGGGGMKKKPDGGKDATVTTDVGGSLDHVDDTPAGEVAADTAADDGGAVADAPPDQGPTTGDAAPEANANDASDASAASDASDAGAPRKVTVVFTGEVVTVAQHPLGFDSTVRTEKVSGRFSYEPALFDLTLDAKRGLYEPGTRASFTFTVKGKTVTGSIHPQLQVENDLPSDTFRYVDGPILTDNTVRTMKVDGVDAPKLKLWIAISDTSGAMLSSDRPPDPFPAIDIKKIPHTFSLEDDGGTLLMQLDTLVNKGSEGGDAGTDGAPDGPIESAPGPDAASDGAAD